MMSCLDSIEIGLVLLNFVCVFAALICLAL